MTDNEDGRRRPMLSVRAALIIISGLLTGLGAAVLMTHAHHSIAQAVLVGAATFAAAVKFFDWLIS